MSNFNYFDQNGLFQMGYFKLRNSNLMTIEKMHPRLAARRREIGENNPHNGTAHNEKANVA